MKVLVAEDDPELARQIISAMKEAGFETAWRSRGDDALQTATGSKWDLILMDAAMPGMDGFDVVRKLRETGSATPVMFITARGDVIHRVEGLTLGADDYLTKPFAMSELVARSSALVRRAKRELATPTFQTPAGWALDPIKRTVTTPFHKVELQPREWSLLEALLTNPGLICTKNYLLERVWNVRFDPGTNVVDAAICRLRRRLDPPEGPSLIETLRGQGYLIRFND